MCHTHLTPGDLIEQWWQWWVVIKRQQSQQFSRSGGGSGLIWTHPRNQWTASWSGRDFQTTREKRSGGMTLGQSQRRHCGRNAEAAGVRRWREAIVKSTGVSILMASVSKSRWPGDPHSTVLLPSILPSILYFPFLAPVRLVSLFHLFYIYIFVTNVFFHRWW